MNITSGNFDRQARQIPPSSYPLFPPVQRDSVDEVFLPEGIGEQDDKGVTMAVVASIRYDSAICSI
jgi:hypothetical protein